MKVGDEKRSNRTFYLSNFSIRRIDRIIAELERRGYTIGRSELVESMIDVAYESLDCRGARYEVRQNI